MLKLFFTVMPASQSFGPKDVEKGKSPEDVKAEHIHPVNYPVGKPLEVRKEKRSSSTVLKCPIIPTDLH